MTVENDEPCMCGTPFTCLADEHDMEVAMTAHPSNPDQLMARALGVCWHSPTSDRWPCQEPLADREVEYAHQLADPSSPEAWRTRP